jgi:hypothetical protein
MSLLTNLTKQQQTYLIHFARQCFPTDFPHQQAMSTALQEEEEDNDIDLEQFSDNEDDGEGASLYRCHEDSEDREEGDEYDEQIRVYSLQLRLTPDSRLKKCQWNFVRHQPRL